MGWTGMQKPDDVAGWMKRQLTWESSERKNECLDVAIVQRETAYAAVKTTYADGTTRIWAAVFKLEFLPRSSSFETFRYKDMSEDSGPFEDTCPARILNRLTPTDSQYANEWRERCRARLARREANKVSDGDCIRFERAVGFTVNSRPGRIERDTFRVVVQGRRVSFMAVDEDGRDDFTCSIPNWRDRSFRKLEGDDVPRPPEPRAGM